MASKGKESQEDPLDEEIKSLKEERMRAPSLAATTHRNGLLTSPPPPVANLRKTLKIECSTILSSSSMQKSLQSSSRSSSSRSRKSKPRNTSKDKLISRSAQQQAYIQQSLYRISTSVTAFKVHDPDPNAVDGGHILGLRFEVMSRGQFLTPYYVMLNRPFFNSSFMRVHRHTVPPAIPLPGLAARHLPAPKPESENPPKQDLERFVRTLRREIMRYHNRLGVSADLRRALGLQDGDREITADSIVDVGIADTEAKQIRLTWADERNGRIVMDDDGKVVKLMVFGTEGRDWETTKEFFGNHEHVDDVAKMLEEFAAG
ncbi:hypothetical protein PT974_01212 [Cladobotryum mycophilum]|uniref:Centromere protein Cenp-O n=1 Tax=Cladobotryum mycophilum TaxID=491253 RepID=A0ABR0T3A7_9HYPO